VGVKGKERLTSWQDAVENGIEWHALIRPSHFLPLYRVRLLEGWKSGWDGSDMGRYAHSIYLWFNFCLGLSYLTATESSFP
jgi:hypothetical protein